jgi:hypothetical protein
MENRMDMLAVLAELINPNKYPPKVIAWAADAIERLERTTKDGDDEKKVINSIADMRREFGV